ncbi:hypothetical protein VPH35_096437 [Triticum aestivum]|uniref:Uncharacterized protein n=3 Tax=Aegilops tauschii subsp. strangulata TaxID=200361 RepID=A0A453K1C6_AEGTS
MDLIKNLVSTVIRAVFTYVYSNLRQSCVYWTTCAKAIHTGQMVLKAWCRFRTHFGYNIMGTKNILLENQVKQHPIFFFLMLYGMLGTLLSFSDVLPLFSNIDWDQNSYLSFVQKHMGAAFEKCSQLSVANIEKAIYNPVTF